MFLNKNLFRVGDTKIGSSKTQKLSWFIVRACTSERGKHEKPLVVVTCVTRDYEPYKRMVVCPSFVDYCYVITTNTFGEK